MTNLNRSENLSGYERFVATGKVDHKKWLSEKYETARRIEAGKPPKDFGYGYVNDLDVERDEAFHTHFYAERAKFELGEPSMVRIVGNVTYLLEQPEVTQRRHQLKISFSLIANSSRSSFESCSSMRRLGIGCRCGLSPTRANRKRRPCRITPVKLNGNFDELIDKACLRCRARSEQASRRSYSVRRSRPSATMIMPAKLTSPKVSSSALNVMTIHRRHVQVEELLGLRRWWSRAVVSGPILRPARSSRSCISITG